MKFSVVSFQLSVRACVGHPRSRYAALVQDWRALRTEDWELKTEH
jgi:hypothetical protein